MVSYNIKRFIYWQYANNRIALLRDGIGLQALPSPQIPIRGNRSAKGNELNNEFTQNCMLFGYSFQ